MLLLSLAVTFALPAVLDKPLEGKWELTSLERDGKPDAAMQGAVRVHEGDKYSLTPKGGKTVTGTYTADAKTLDMKPDDGRYKGKTLLGIYKIEGDTLTICFADPGQPRPTEFASKTGVVVAVHKRLK